MSANRAAHTATALSDGRVLVAGGFTEKGSAKGAEVYELEIGRFSPLPPMLTTRHSHTATLLPDGRVLVVGGHNGRRGHLTLLASAEIYDPVTGVFGRANAMQIRRHKHDGVLLPDGRVLITGGSDERDGRGVYNSSEIFIPRTGAFTPGPTMQLGRYKHAGTSVVLPSGLVLVAGGAPQAEVYDPRGNTFALVPGDPQMEGQFSAVALLKTAGVLITGGYGQGGGRGRMPGCTNREIRALRGAAQLALAPDNRVWHALCWRTSRASQACRRSQTFFAYELGRTLRR